MKFATILLLTSLISTNVFAANVEVSYPGTNRFQIQAAAKSTEYTEGCDKALELVEKTALKICNRRDYTDCYLTGRQVLHVNNYCIVIQEYRGWY